MREWPAAAPGRLGTAGGAALAAILIGGFALRLWGVAYGLPHPMARPDEEVLVKRLLGFDAGDPNPHWFMYPTFYLYVLFGWVKVLVVGAHALGLAPATGLAEVDPARVYLAARALSVVLGTATIAVAFVLARAFWDVRAGLLAAVVLAVGFLHVRDSHFFKPDVAQGLGTLATLLACVPLQRRGTVRDAVIAGVVAGLTLGIKYNVVLLLPVAAAALQAGRAGLWSRLLAAGGAAVAVVVVTSPYIVLDYRTFAGWMAYTRLLLTHTGGGLGTGFAYHARHSFLLAQGLPLSLFTLGAVLWAARQRACLPLTVFLVASLLQLGGAALAYTRYVTPLVPVLSVVVGGALARVTATAPPGVLRQGLTTLLLLVLLARPAASAVEFDRLAARPDTRLLARHWLDAHVPPNTIVLVLGAPWPYTFGDPVLDGYRVRRNPNLNDGVAYVVTHEHPLPWSEVPDGLAVLLPRLRLEATFGPGPAGGEPSPGAVFEPGDAFYLPLAGFAGVERGGPLVRVYSVVDGAG